MEFGKRPSLCTVKKRCSMRAETLTVTDERSGNVKLLCQDPGDQSSVNLPAV